MFIEPSPPIEISASIWCSRKARISSSERSISVIVAVELFDRVVQRVAAVGGAQDRAAQVRDAAHTVARQADQPAFEDTVRASAARCSHRGCRRLPSRGSARPAWPHG